jgi:hypothetical protein
MDPSFHEKSIGSALTIIFLTNKYRCGRLFGDRVAVQALKSYVQPLLCRRGR